MIVHLRANEIIDQEMEAHYSFKTIRPLANSHGRIVTTIYHDHDFYELFLISFGQIIHIVNDTEILLPVGSLVFIRPNDCHSFRQYRREDCGLINLAFPKQTIAALFTYLGDGFHSEGLLDPELPPTVLLNDSETQTVAAQLAKLNRIPHTEKGRIRTQLRLLLVELLGWQLTKDKFMKSIASQDWLGDL